MIEATADPPKSRTDRLEGDSPVPDRIDARAGDWPLRPWIMAVLCALAALIFHLLIDHAYPETLSPERQAAATLVGVGTLSFVLTVERLRLLWALGFALGWGLVIALVGWFTASYDRAGGIFEWPFLSGLFAVLLAAPLFQTARDEGGWRFPYPRLHSHAWTDAVIGAASLFFTGVTFLLAWLIAGLFDIIGIDAVEELLQEEWFAWMLAGFAFGGALGMLRQRDRLVPTLQRLAMAILSVLAPVLAFALVAFLLSIVFTGLQGLWDSWISATALLLVASAGSVLLANAVIGDSAEQRPRNHVLRWSALILIAVILPLAVLAGMAMGIRIGQYGWTPERIWGAIAVTVALAYGLGGWWTIWRGRRDFDEQLRPLQTGLAIALCGLALFLALPILDFGAISARSQVARLEQGRIEPAKFDWAAMAFDFGPSGRARLAELARSGPAEWREHAAAALRADQRWGVAEQTRAAVEVDELAGRIRVLSDDLRLTPDILRRVSLRRQCPAEAGCALMRLDERRLLLVTSYGEGGHVTSAIIDLTVPADVELARPAPPGPQDVNLESAQIEVRPIQRRQLFVNGQPVGEPFE